MLNLKAASPSWLYGLPVEEIEKLAIDADAELKRPAGPDLARKAMRLVMRAYRTMDYVDAETFVMMAVSALEDMPECAVRMLADPKQGIIREAKFPPTIAELVAWCDKAIAPAWGAIGECRYRAENVRYQIDKQRYFERLANDIGRREEIEAANRERAELESRIAANPEKFVTSKDDFR